MRKVPHKATGYRPDIQGLRALAILLVLVFHLYPNALPGGYIGVDVFFVISGFLITGHLASRFARTGRVQMLEFYGRRARRLLPAAVIVLVVTWLGSRILLPVTQREAAAEQVRASALYLQNWVLAHNSVDYMKENDAPSPVQHYWSLSVEEQFYLIWPLLLVLAVVTAIIVGKRVGRRAARRPALMVAGIGATLIITGSLWYSVHETSANQAAAYFVTPTRLWELGAGGLLALTYPTVSRWIGRFGIVSWLGLGIVIAAAVVLSGSSPFPGALALLPVVGTALLIVAGSPQARGSTAAIFARRPAVFIGDISYSMYLWHWPLIILYLAYSGGTVGYLDGPVLAAASVVLAWLSKIWVEDPFRRARWIAPHPGRSLATATAAVIPLALTTTFLLQQPTAPPAYTAGSHEGAELLAMRHQGDASDQGNASDQGAADSTGSQQTDTGQAEPQQADAEQDNSAAPDGGSTSGKSSEPEPLDSGHPDGSELAPPLAAAPKDLPLANTHECKTPGGKEKLVSCTRGETKNPKLTIALIGDSFAAEWSSVLIDVAKREHWKIVTVTHDSCPWTTATLMRQGSPATKCHAWGKDVLHFLTDDVHPDIAMVSYHPGPVVKGYSGRSQASDTALTKGMIAYWKKLAASGTFIVGIHPTPDPEINAPDCLSSRVGSIESCTAPRSKADAKTTAIDRAAAALGPRHATTINLNDYICTATECPPVVGGVVVYRDEKHLTKTYSLTLAPYLRHALMGISEMRQ